MKRFWKKFLSSFLAVLMVSSILCTFAAASERSSAYLSAYRAGITPESDGKLVITVDVTGVGRMSEIGAKTIYVYESTDGQYFRWVATYESSDYPQMMGSGSIFYEDVITHQGTPGRYYYAKACVYAGNDTGGDERYCNTAIKKAIS